MVHIPWKKYSSMADTCEVGTYLLKRKLVRGGMTYEIWKGGELIQKTTRYGEFVKVVAPIVNTEK